MVCEIFAYKLYKNYMKELKIKAKTNKLFKIPLVFYSPRQRVSWSSEADLQYFIARGRGFPGALRLIPSTLFPEAEGFLSSEADPQYSPCHVPLPGTLLSTTHPSAEEAETTSL